MNSIQLGYFLKISQTGNFTSAARQLFVSQPALSKQMALLEQELCTVLFIRRPHGVQLTPAGRSLQKFAGEILQRMEEIPAALSSLCDSPAGELKIVCGNFLSQQLVPELLKELLRRYPEILPHIRETPKASHPELLQNGQAEIGLGSLNHIPDWLCRNPLFSSKLVLIRSIHSRLARRKRLTLEEIAKEKMIGYPRGSFLYDEIDRIMQGYQKNILMDSHASSTIIELVRENFGLAFVPEYLIPPEKRAGIAVGGFSTGVEISIGYYYCREHTLSPQARAFIQVIRKHFQLDPL